MAERRTARNASLVPDEGGKGRPDIFYSDCSMPGMLYGAVVRCPYARGTVAGIRIRSLPEGYFFFTARDFPGRNTVRTLNSATKIFCSGRISYQGEPAGIVAGPDLETARRLAGEAEIVFDADTVRSALNTAESGYTRPVISVAAAREAAAGFRPAVAESGGRMPAYRTAESRGADYGEDGGRAADARERPFRPLPAPADFAPRAQDPRGESGPDGFIRHRREIIAERIVRTGMFARPNASREKILQSSDFDVTGTWTQKICQPAWNETNGAFCFVRDGTLTVLTATQWPVYLRETLSAALGMDADKIVIRKTVPPHRKANGMWRNAALAVQAAMAALLTGKPVLLMLSREEQNRFMQPDTDVRITHRTAVSRDGVIKAMRINIQINMGTENPFASEITDRLAIAAAGFYNPESLFISARAYTSPEPPTSIYPELIDSQSFFAVENHIQQIAARTDILPTELRLKNLCTDPKKAVSPFFFGLTKPAETMQAAAEQSDFNRKYTAFRLDSLHRARADAAPFFALPRRGIGLACAFDGSGYCGTDIFAGNQKISVTFETDDTVTIHSPLPSDSIAEIWKKSAAEVLQIPAESVRISADFAGGKAPSMPENAYSNISVMSRLLRRCCMEIQRKRFHKPLPITAQKSVTPAMRRQWDSKAFSGNPFYTNSFGAAVVEIELDPYTFREKIKGIWIAIDCGEVYSLKAAEYAIRLAIQQELTALVQDETVPCDAVRISFIQSNGSPGQIGELVHNTVPAAFTSALSLALASPVTRLPCTEDQIYGLTRPETAEARPPAEEAKKEA